MSGRPVRQQSFSFIVADDEGDFTEYAAVLPPAVVKHVGIVLREMADVKRLRLRQSIRDAADRVARRKPAAARIHLVPKRKRSA